MTLEAYALADIGGGGSPVTGTTPAQRMIAELQLKRTSVLAGAAADTNIAVAGLMIGDHVFSCIHLTVGVPVDLTAEVVILSNGNIQLDTTDTSTDYLLLEWAPKPEKYETGLTGAAAATNIAVAGIQTGDTILSLTSPKAGGGDYDYLSEASITSDGNVQCATTVTTGRVLVIAWAPAAL